MTSLSVLKIATNEVGLMNWCTDILPRASRGSNKRANNRSRLAQITFYPQSVRKNRREKPILHIPLFEIRLDQIYTPQLQRNTNEQHEAACFFQLLFRHTILSTSDSANRLPTDCSSFWVVDRYFERQAKLEKEASHSDLKSLVKLDGWRVATNFELM